MEPVTWIFGGITIAVVSGAVGKGLNNRNKVKEVTCEERRGACTALLSTKIDNLADDIKEIKDAVSKNVQ